MKVPPTPLVGFRCEAEQRETLKANAESVRLEQRRKRSPRTTLKAFASDNAESVH